MRTSDIHVAVLSDIHLGNRRTPTRDIIRNLDAAFPDNGETAQLDLICLAGDVFHTLFTLNDDDVLEIDFWICRLLTLCRKHDIILYVVEGTRSHDWEQLARFDAINRFAGIGAKLRYVNQISLEYEPSLDIWIGCVPDESAPTTDQALERFMQLMKAKGIGQVDLMFMHGSFDFQVPAVSRTQKHDSKAWLAITRYLVFVGHEHIHSSFERIYAQGSFDRIAHGEEGPKGHLRAILHRDGEYEITFVENTGARRYITIACTDLPVEDALRTIDARIRELPEHSAVRIEANYDHPLLADMDALVRLYPFFSWSKNPLHPDNDTLKTFDEEDVFEPITIHAGNILQLVSERMIAAGVSPTVLALAQQKIQECM
jgi:metallophosphoesterase superfamily enzyme